MFIISCVCQLINKECMMNELSDLLSCMANAQSFKHSNISVHVE